ncbi:MAG TPA: septum formation initiator family protein [Pyrinomonadaceae bacterium]|nr:septum formation initiator family protein [Pyrinomonadaceae bacterium]
MNKAVNTYWVDDRLRTQRVAARALPTLMPARDLSREIIGTRTDVRRRGGLIPSWVIFGMIILATFALCVTVTMRTHAEMRAASQQYEQMNADVEMLRSSNAALELEVRRLRTDPRAIESAARTRLNMVRPNEIVVPVE